MSRLLLLIFSALLLLTSCQEEHFIKNPDYRQKVEKRFEQRKAYAQKRSEQLFSVFDKKLSLKEKEALQFLYAYMPLNDLADYSGEFFLSQVKTAFEAKNSFSWGKIIPEEVFRHFVLPYRINNENLDSARMVFFKELKPRIINMNLKDAILEVNHWCHEKVTYKPTDIRTSAPLSTARTSWGRCGEESTFTVTALRAVGIPARQVYTPRWAHCDDNHAWVEVWVDGNWYYLGACEPEGDLNIAWFTEPVKRAMMVHTRVFGDYEADDGVVEVTDNYTKINTLPYYTKVKKVTVNVRDKNNNPVENAIVEFGLYNYAEFYPLASKATKPNGITCLKTGFGDLVISANHNGMFNSKKISVSEVDTVEIILSDKEPKENFVTLDLVPPIIKDSMKIDVVLTAENVKRLKKEDEIRNSYMNTFIKEEEAKAFAKEKNLDAERVWKLLDKSEGNWKNVKEFISEAVDKNIKPEKIFGLLEKVNDKDLRDTEKNILEDHLYNTPENKGYNKEVYYKYVLNPRIKNEMITPYKKVLGKAFAKFDELKSEEKAVKIEEEIKKNIKIDNPQNYYNLPVTPIGVNELNIANDESRDIYFVAICRSLGIPSRLEEAEKIPQYFNGSEWVTVNFKKRENKKIKSGYLKLTNSNSAVKIEPQYYIHFTIGKLENGVYKTLDYQWEKRLSQFPDKLKLEKGKYRLITGNRKSNGTVLSNITYFDVKENKTTKIKINLRKDPTPVKVLGKVDINRLGKFSKEFAVIGWIDPDKEPTKHFFTDLKSLKAEFEKWNGNISLMIPDEKKTAAFDGKIKETIPVNVTFPEDKNSELQKLFTKQMNLPENISYPLITVVNKKGEIVFKSTGYKIGLGEQLLKIIL